jgi:hypothetical protein
MQKRRLMATATGNNVRTRVKKNFEDPWMQSSWPVHLANDVPESKEARKSRGWDLTLYLRVSARVFMYFYLKYKIMFNCI